VWVGGAACVFLGRANAARRLRGRVGCAERSPHRLEANRCQPPAGVCLGTPSLASPRCLVVKRLFSGVVLAAASVLRSRARSPHPRESSQCHRRKARDRTMPQRQRRGSVETAPLLGSTNSSRSGIYAPRGGTARRGVAFRPLPRRRRRPPRAPNHFHRRSRGPFASGVVRASVAPSRGRFAARSPAPARSAPL
jgi:hypothetical protein